MRVVDGEDRLVVEQLEGDRHEARRGHRRDGLAGRASEAKKASSVDRGPGAAAAGASPR